MALFYERNSDSFEETYKMPNPCRAFCASFLSVVFLLTAVPAGAQKNSPTSQDRERERHSLAVNIVRAINNAEANYKKTNGAYATWDALLSNNDFTEGGTKWISDAFPTVAHAMYGPAPEIVPGWKLRLQISKNGNAYDLVLEDANDPKCRFAVISDETGVIRQGKALDCPI
jgi:hypothetical protein